MKNFLKLLISATSQESSKRAVVIGAIIGYLAAIVVLIVLLVLIIIRALLLSDTMTVEFFTTFRDLFQGAKEIIILGVFGIVISGVANVIGSFMNKKSEAAIEAAKNKVPAVNVENIENVDAKNGDKLEG